MGLVPIWQITMQSDIPQVLTHRIQHREDRPYAEVIEYGDDARNEHDNHLDVHAEMHGVNVQLPAFRLCEAQPLPASRP
jgi:hypothetical protein